jgi:hypothetical protein
VNIYPIIQEVNKILFEHEIKRLRNHELELVRENANLGGSSDGFRYNGKVFTQQETKLISRGKFTVPNVEMLPAVKLYLEDSNLIDYDKLRVNQAMTLVLKDTKSTQDVRDALPECLVQLLPSYRQYQRTRPEAFTLSENPRSYNQYMNLREKIEFYVASKMLY